MTLYITNVMDTPLWVPGTIKAPADDDGKEAKEAGVTGKTDQGLLAAGEKVLCEDEEGARTFARMAGEQRVKLTAK